MDKIQKINNSLNHAFLSQKGKLFLEIEDQDQTSSQDQIQVGFVTFKHGIPKKKVKELLINKK